MEIDLMKIILEFIDSIMYLVRQFLESSFSQ